MHTEREVVRLRMRGARLRSFGRVACRLSSFTEFRIPLAQFWTEPGRIRIGRAAGSSAAASRCCDGGALAVVRRTADVRVRPDPAQ